MDAAVSCVTLYLGALVLQGRRRFRAQRGAAGRRHDHALSSRAHAHRLARMGAQALHVLHAGHQNGTRPRGAAQGGDLGGGLLFSRHRVRAPSGGQEARRERHPGGVQCAGRDRDLCQSVRGEDALDKLEAFASLNGPKHYRLSPNEDRTTLEKSAWTAPPAVKVEGPDEKALIYRGGESIEWQVVSD